MLIKLQPTITKVTMDSYFRCDCPVVCANFEEYKDNHSNMYEQWADRVDAVERYDEHREIVERMLKGEPYARKKRGIRPAGYVPKTVVVVPKAKRPGKPLCNKGPSCCNKKCTFVHPERQ